MRDHANVRHTFWTRGSGKKLRGNRDAQLLALYFITSEAATMCGIYYLPIPTIMHHLSMTEEEFRKALARVSEVGLAYYDEDGELVWVPNLADQEIGDTLRVADNRHKGLLKALSSFGNHPFVQEFYRIYSTPYELGKAPSPESPSQAPSESLLSQKQKQKQLQDQKQETPFVELAEPTSTASGPVREVFDVWAAETLVVHPKARPALDEKRAKLIRARLKTYTVEELQRACRGMFRCPHNRGENDRQTEYLTIEIALRDAGNIERFGALIAPAASAHAPLAKAGPSSEAEPTPEERAENERLGREASERIFASLASKVVRSVPA